ncbi:MAG TPA: YsnF/AvaK domain-containing protein [Pyrinomonadaceae bacterium]|nr:YsnF/AvaK domain-containing protein [Pyrinomonadaceae bacterium]
MRDIDGLRATVTQQDLERQDGQVLVRLADGRQLLVPAEELRVEEDGGFSLPFSFAEVTEAVSRADAARAPVRDDGRRRREDGTVVVPVVAERLEVQKRKVEAGDVRSRKTVTDREEVVDEPLLREEVHVKRVPVGRVVDGPIPVRHVGDTMIISLLEEVLVVEKRLMLKEELHVTKGEVETYKPQRVVLRSEEAFVERVDAQGRRDEGDGRDGEGRDTRGDGRFSELDFDDEPPPR